MEQYREQIMGDLAPHFQRFLLLRKFLDAQQLLSVQMHPSDAHPELLPPVEMSKTEAWVVMEAAHGSRIYAGLEPGTTKGELRNSLSDGTIAEHLARIVPRPGDAVFNYARTIHTLGEGVVVFEVQHNSDVMRVAAPTARRHASSVCRLSPRATQKLLAPHTALFKLVNKCGLSTRLRLRSDLASPLLSLPPLQHITRNCESMVLLGCIRKNSLFVDNERGGQTPTIQSSFTSTCRRLGIDAQLYSVKEPLL